MIAAFFATIVIVAGSDVWLLGVGFVTVIDRDPGVRMSVLRICVVTCEESTNVVARFAPPTLTVALLAKFVPTTCSVNPGPVALTVLGFSKVIVGFGGVLVTVKGTRFDRWRFGFVTVTLIVRGEVISVAGI